MGLFDEVGEVKELGLDEMPLVDLFKAGIKSIEAFERGPNTATYAEMEKTLNMVIARFDEVPDGAKGMISGVPLTITNTMPTLKQMLSMGPNGASVIPVMTGSMKTSLNFAISRL